MLFTSPVFVVFFCVLYALVSLPLGWRVKKGFLLAGSIVFYAVWNPPYVLLLMASTVVDFVVGLALERAQTGGVRKSLLALSLAANLGVLGTFKYADFLRESFMAAAEGLGLQCSLAPFNLLLPIGISFYTFQTMSYSIDVYRREISACRNLLDFSLFVSFFPQLVAGPIVRASEFLPQLKRQPKVEPRHIHWGAMLFILGLFKKVFLADIVFAPAANMGFNPERIPGALDAWTATYAFAGQIFCDFSGYSDMALGMAMTLGFVLPDNFRAPYAAAGFSDFWRRWHMSLSRWLRDYLYIPLGGNRHGGVRTTINLALTMLLGGLWHGANWTYVAWGGLHGAYLGVERLFRGTMMAKFMVSSRFARALAMLVTFQCICMAWVLFRARDFQHAGVMFTCMFGLAQDVEDLVPNWETVVALLALGALIAVQVLTRGMHLEQAAQRVPRWLLVLFAGVMLFLVFTSGGKSGDFIYFAF